MPRRLALFFLLAVAAQLLILAVFPMEKAYVRQTGRTVLLRLQPVDPFDVLSGYYQTLTYVISDVGSFQPAPPRALPEQGTVWAVVKRGEDGTWDPVSLSTSRPTRLGADELVLRGQLDGRITYGIETFYFPEKDRERLNRLFAENLERLRAEVRVSEGGRAALVGIRVGEQTLDEYLEGRD